MEHEKTLHIISHKGSTDSNHNDTSTHPTEWLKTVKSVVRDVEKPEPSYVVGGKVKWYTATLNSLAVS